MPEDSYFEEQTFDGIDFTEQSFSNGEYELCTFKNCTFAQVDFSGFKFIDCQFENCDLTLVKVTTTSFQNVKFQACKIIGVHFDEVNSFLFAVAFKECILNLSSFKGLDLTNSTFHACSLEEVDFSAANMEGLVLEECNCRLTIFENTMLQKADFRTAVNYNIDPEKNAIKHAQFSKYGLKGLLNKYDIIIE